MVWLFAQRCPQPRSAPFSVSNICRALPGDRSLITLLMHLNPCLLCAHIGAICNVRTATKGGERHSVFLSPPFISIKSDSLMDRVCLKCEGSKINSSAVRAALKRSHAFHTVTYFDMQTDP